MIGALYHQNGRPAIKIWPQPAGCPRPGFKRPVEDYCFNLKYKVPAGGVMVTLLFVPLSLVAPLKFDQFVVVRLKFCCNMNLVAADGQEIFAMAGLGST